MKLDTLSIDSLKEIVKVAKEQGVAELQVEAKDFKVSVNFATAPAAVHHVQPIVHQAPVAMAAPAPVAAAAPAKAAANDAGLHVIKSPFVGTFYASPSPGKPVYAKVGDKVKTGQPLCVLEAMKIMNEIDSDVNGEIVEICVDNESLVEYGQPLFKIRK
ncbi:acetyl-CoA carboxylase biotin carboxyl carrier protein [Peredibacter starrii]|uniref:Biotin carboxyl carrier protein of acetyl-CoA carboxylase n=1 Tax=Peredibacter starrii TaxID=28202 RepID=A0AAX4HRG6_9BACT|nr:acetyl-CoA carboxylase biotin carboxyl carrier protein [Peredibacter starrii]WPU65544.1 acetyl-CoA carboxylase biotin carboxyl carrier protein [Peredibacter starrii]